MRTFLVTLILSLTVTMSGQNAFAPAGQMVRNKSAAGGGSSTLNTGLTAYWKLDENSGTRVDSGSNGQDLTDNNTVLFGTGKISNAADFEYDNDEYLNRADSATLSLSTDTDFTLALWFKSEGEAAFQGDLISKCTDNGNEAAEYRVLAYDSLGNIGFIVGNGSTGAALTSGTAPSSGTWYFVVAWHSSTDNKLYLQINNGTPAEAAWSGGTQDSGSAFVMGARAYNTGFAYDGLIDEVGFWKRVLTSDERTELYNSGNAKTCCPF